MGISRECTICGGKHHWAECNEPEAEAIGLGFLGSSQPVAVHDPEIRILLANRARERNGNPELKDVSQKPLAGSVYDNFISQVGS